MRGHHNPLAWAATLLLAVAYAHVILELAGALVGVAVAVRLLASTVRNAIRRRRQLGRRPGGIRYRPLALPAVQPDNGRVMVDPDGIARAFARLEQARGRLRHAPTVNQMRVMARHDGREPCSYLMDPKHNIVPDPARLGCERGREQHALCFTCTDPQGAMRELVVTSTGLGFDLLGERRWIDLAGH